MSNWLFKLGYVIGWVGVILGLLGWTWWFVLWCIGLIACVCILAPDTIAWLDAWRRAR